MEPATEIAKKLASLDKYMDKLNSATDFPKGIDWFNLDPSSETPSLKTNLKGKIVVIDFWSSCCINCIHVLAEMKRLEEKFKDNPEIVFIGCHCAKFDNEKNSDLLKAAILRYDIRHAVVNDKEFELWEANGVNCWPTVITIGPQGKII